LGHLRIWWELFKVWRETLFSSKWGLTPQKGGHDPPFEEKKGFTQKKLYQNVPTDVSFGIGTVNTKKILTNTNQNY
jgi:hypothetical protein